MGVVFNVHGELIKRTQNKIVGAFSQLLQERHLYQSISVSSDYLGRVEGGVRKTPVIIANHDRRWTFQFKDSQDDGSVSPIIPLHVENIKLYCRRCKRVEAFVASEKYSNETFVEDREQMFVLGFLCQSCKTPKAETFMIKRSGAKLTLCGRFPMEQVAIPKVFPKTQSKFISDATIAHNAGQTLAGLFLLRTFVEQYVLAEIGVGRAEETLTKYGETIPENIRQQIPSLLDLYGRLSAAIHSANADAVLFDEVIQKLELHFDTKRVLGKLSELNGKID